MFFLRINLMMVDDVMLSKTASGLSGIRKIGAAKQPQRPSNPVLPYLAAPCVRRLPAVSACVCGVVILSANYKHQEQISKSK